MEDSTADGVCTFYKDYGKNKYPIILGKLDRLMKSIARALQQNSGSYQNISIQGIINTLCTKLYNIPQDSRHLIIQGDTVWSNWASRIYTLEEPPVYRLFNQSFRKIIKKDEPVDSKQREYNKWRILFLTLIGKLNESDVDLSHEAVAVSIQRGLNTKKYLIRKQPNTYEEYTPGTESYCSSFLSTTAVDIDGGEMYNTYTDNFFKENNFTTMGPNPTLLVIESTLGKFSLRVNEFSNFSTENEEVIPPCAKFLTIIKFNISNITKIDTESYLRFKALYSAGIIGKTEGQNITMKNDTNGLNQLLIPYVYFQKRQEIPDTPSEADRQLHTEVFEYVSRTLSNVQVQIVYQKLLGIGEDLFNSIIKLEENYWNTLIQEETQKKQTLGRISRMMWGERPVDQEIEHLERVKYYRKEFLKRFLKKFKYHSLREAFAIPATHVNRRVVEAQSLRKAFAIPNKHGGSKYYKKTRKKNKINNRYKSKKTKRKKPKRKKTKRKKTKKI